MLNATATASVSRTGGGGTTGETMSRVRFRSRAAFVSCLLGGSLLSTVVVGATAASAARPTTTTVAPAAPVTSAPPTTGAATLEAPTTTTPLAPVGDPFQPPPTSSATTQVSIIDFGYSPATVTVAAGSTVSWTNTGDAIHSVSSDTGAFDSSPSCPTGSCIDPGGTYSHVFAAAGRFAYHCKVHPDMTGAVVVNAAPATTTTTTASPGSSAGNPPVSGGGGVTPTTTGSTDPELASTGVSAVATWLVLGALVAISIGLALRPRRRAYPIPVSTDRSDRH